MSAAPRRAFLVAGLGYGDEGKGTTVDYLARRLGAKLVVRYNGGAQAAHNVVLPGGAHHTFSQFGAGALAGARTHLSQHVVVNPVTMLLEEEHLRELVDDPLSGVTVDEDALVTTRFHVAGGRIREMARGAGRHGSCGMGVNETVQDAADGAPTIRVRDLRRPGLRDLLTRVRDHKAEQVRSLVDLTSDAMAEEFAKLTAWSWVDTTQTLFDQWAQRVCVVSGEWLAEVLRRPGAVIFEGAQGVLLDQTHGFFPYVTRSDCTFANADELLRDAAYDGQVTRLGVTRTYQTRHGAGPMPTERRHLSYLAAGDHNARNEWQGGFRVGHLDLVIGRHAARCVGRLDALAVTWADRVDPDNVPVCVEYVGVERDAPPTLELTRRVLGAAIKHMSIGEYAEHLGTTVAVVSRGPTHENKTAIGGLL